MDQSVSIRDLQRMLDQLSRRTPALPRLAITGVFDEPTLEAVMIFQRDFFPPVTGVVNEATWDAIKDAYRLDLLRYGDPALLRVLADGDFSAPQGAYSDSLLIAEAIFASLAGYVSNFTQDSFTGQNSGQLHNNLLELQSLANLPINGTLDTATWEYLTRLYHAFIVRRSPAV